MTTDTICANIFLAAILKMKLGGAYCDWTTTWRIWPRLCPSTTTEDALLWTDILVSVCVCQWSFQPNKRAHNFCFVTVLLNRWVHVNRHFSFSVWLLPWSCQTTMCCGLHIYVHRQLFHRVPVIMVQWYRSKLKRKDHGRSNNLLTSNIETSLCQNALKMMNE